MEVFRGDPRVHITDRMEEDMPSIYAATDVCVLPSYREGLPTIALESAAMQVPIVATRIPGCVDAVVDGVTGVLVEPHDARALAAALLRLLKDSDLRTRMGRAGREFVQARFSEDRVSELLLKEYRRLLSRRGLHPELEEALPT
jgi:glycosyltransferase involved in cell wall biosynthesis